MDLTTAAKTLTAAIAENVGTYARHFMEEGQALAADVSKALPEPIGTSDAEELFSLYLDIERTDDVYRVIGSPRAEQEAMRAIHAYCAELNRALRDTGYEGEDFTADYYDDLT